MVSHEKLHMDVEVHGLTVQATLALFYMYISIHVHENLQENMIHGGIVHLVCIALPVNAQPVETCLIYVEI